MIARRGFIGSVMALLASPAVRPKPEFAITGPGTIKGVFIDQGILTRNTVIAEFVHRDFICEETAMAEVMKARGLV